MTTPGTLGETGEAGGAAAVLSLSVSSSLVVLSNRVTTVARDGKTSIDLYHPSVKICFMFPEQLPWKAPSRMRSPSIDQPGCLLNS